MARVQHGYGKEGRRGIESRYNLGIHDRQYGADIYVFEVQTKGSIDSLIINLLKALNNPAVQGVVAVSDAAQLEKIRKHAEQVPNLGAKLKYWDYKKVLKVHDSLEMVNESINRLGLVPQGF